MGREVVEVALLATDVQLSLAQHVEHYAIYLAMSYFMLFHQYFFKSWYVLVLVRVPYAMFGVPLLGYLFLTRHH